jgi:hypothetical protein
MGQDQYYDFMYDGVSWVSHVPNVVTFKPHTTRLIANTITCRKQLVQPNHCILVCLVIDSCGQLVPININHYEAPNGFIPFYFHTTFNYCNPPLMKNDCYKLSNYFNSCGLGLDQLAQSTNNLE